MCPFILNIPVLSGKRAHSVRGIRAPNPSHTQGSELELQDLRRFRPTAQQTWRRDWPERRSRDCDVTSSNENSLKKLIHYGDWECIPLRSSFILRITYPQSSVTPPLAGPSGRRPPGMWRSPEPPPGSGGRPGLNLQPPKASLGHPGDVHFGLLKPISFIPWL